MTITNKEIMTIYSQVAQLEVQGVDADALRETLEPLNDILKSRSRRRKLFAILDQNTETDEYFLLAIGQETIYFDTLNEADKAIEKIELVWDLRLTDNVGLKERREFNDAVERLLN